MYTYYSIIPDQLKPYVSNALRSLRIEIDVTAVQRIAVHEVLRHHSIETVRSQANTDEVVDDHETLGVETLSLLHELHEHKDGNEVEGVTNQKGLQIHEREVEHVLLYP